MLELKTNKSKKNKFVIIFIVAVSFVILLTFCCVLYFHFNYQNTNQINSVARQTHHQTIQSKVKQSSINAVANVVNDQINKINKKDITTAISNSAKDQSFKPLKILGKNYEKQIFNKDVLTQEIFKETRAEVSNQINQIKTDITNQIIEEIRNEIITETKQAIKAQIIQMKESIKQQIISGTTSPKNTVSGTTSPKNTVSDVATNIIKTETESQLKNVVKNGIQSLLKKK